MRIGFICEGVTDLAVLENIFYGLFDEDDLDITALAPPPIDHSKPIYERNDRLGGWERLKDHLTTLEFKKSVDNHDYLIIQIDSDEAQHINFNVTIDIKKNGDHLNFINRIEDKLIEWINVSSYINYEEYKHKIIFCVCIHSIECWILAHCNVQSNEIVSCENKMLTYLSNLNLKPKPAKDVKTYKKVTKSLKKEIEIIALSERCQSFNHFICKVFKIRDISLIPDYIFLGLVNYRSLIMNFQNNRNHL